MPAAVRRRLNELCDDAMVRSIRLFPKCKTLIGIGRFAEERVKYVCKNYELNHEIGYLMHPSPRNPTANREWNQHATRCLHTFGLLDHVTSQSDNDTNIPAAADSVKRELFNS